MGSTRTIVSHTQPVETPSTTTNSEQKIRTERKPTNLLNEETSDGIHPAKEQRLIRKAETEEKQHSSGALRSIVLQLLLESLQLELS
ncbi:hypothetical protein AAFF_G00316130 [Aldrovandia affinis]|uniref:Uncharacterized protein n=1 Tax=Aldrovandia affinis TaxID=143900 RepID=A0AAD7SNX7_9TELE|nr:hypothetical protein AAFF_G00316130 [Aldrovandia affinis]